MRTLNLQLLFNNFRIVKTNVREESNKNFIILRVLHIQHVSRRIFLKFTNFSYCSLKCQKSASLPLIKFTNFQSICSFTKINKNNNKSKKKRLMAICLLLVCFLLGCSSSLGMVSRRIRDNQIKASTVKKRELNTKGKDGRLNVVGGWCVEKLENYEYTQSNRKYKSFLPKEFLGKQSHEFRILKYQA